MLAFHRAIERSFVGELVGCLVNGRIREAPESPGLLHPEGLRGIGQMFILIPLVECLAFFGVRDRRTNDEKGGWHGFLRIVFSLGDPGTYHHLQIAATAEIRHTFYMPEENK